MTTSRGLELAVEARAHVARVLKLLVRADAAALDSSTAELAGAVALVEQIVKEGPEGLAGVKPVLAGLRSDLRRVGSLLRHAWEFRVYPCGPSGYTPKGGLALRQPSAGRWSVEA